MELYAGVTVLSKDGSYVRRLHIISKDNLHQTGAEAGAYRQQWAKAMLAEAYATGIASATMPD